MAYKPKDASYFIRQTKEGEWSVTKFLGSGGGESSQPDQIYTIKAQTSQSRGTEHWCDCPASWAGREGVKKPCKHLTWLSRWKALYGSNKLAVGEVAFYDSRSDRFYRAEGLTALE
jgi:hypothetical protein